MSLWKLIAWTVFDLAVAVMIGTTLTVLLFSVMFPYRPARELAFCYGLHSLGVPLTTPGLREKYERASSQWRYYLTVDCQRTPPDDQALVDWLRGKRPARDHLPSSGGPENNAPFDVEDVKRLPSWYSSGGTSARVNVTLIGAKGRELPAVPWDDLGYKAASWPPLWEARAPFMQDGPPPAGLRLIFIGFMQIGLVVVGLVRWWRNRRVATELPRGEGRALLAALGVAVALTGLFWVHWQAVRYFFSPSIDPAGCLNYIPSAGWFVPLPYQSVMMTVQPPWSQLVAGVVFVLGVPLAQELFFRGGLLGMWAGAGRFWAGAVLSALAAAALLVSWTIFPVLLVAGLALAWLYGWSRSLLATLLAHIVFNAAVLCMIYGLIPSLPHQVDLLCGQWEEEATIEKGKGKGDGKAPPKETGEREVVRVHLKPYNERKDPPAIDFLRGGTVRGGRVVSKKARLTPRRYEWVGPDEIEVRWAREEIVGVMATTTTLEFVRYKVAVDWKQLTLTRESDGKVFRYHRRF
jgi:membrane protease YdiL (CAAX protease family)